MSEEKPVQKKKRISVKSAKAKGRRLQSWVAEQISKITGIPVEKDGDIEQREMGQAGVDVKLRGDAREVFPFSVECKNAERWNIPKAIEQAKENKLEGTNWLVIMKKNNHEPVVIIDAKVFFEIYGDNIEWKYGPLNEEKNNGKV